MITIHITCSCCGKEFPGNHLSGETAKDRSTETIIREIEKDSKVYEGQLCGWQTQQNGDILDVYCSMRCAS